MVAYQNAHGLPRLDTRNDWPWMVLAVRLRPFFHCTMMGKALQPFPDCTRCRTKRVLACSSQPCAVAAQLQLRLLSALQDGSHRLDNSYCQDFAAACGCQPNGEYSKDVGEASCAHTGLCSCHRDQ